MADGRKASCVAHHGMVDGECSSTAAGLWCVLELPVVSEADSITIYETPPCEERNHGRRVGELL